MSGITRAKFVKAFVLHIIYDEQSSYQLFKINVTNSMTVMNGIVTVPFTKDGKQPIFQILVVYIFLLNGGGSE